MKKILCFGFILFAFKINAQQLQIKDNVYIIKAEVLDTTRICLDCGTKESKNDPIFIIKGKETLISIEGKDLKKNHISVDDFQKIEVIKPEKAIEIYGDIAKNGAVLITLKPEAKLLRFSDVIYKLNINNKYNRLPFYFNNELIEDTNKFFVSESVINKVIVKIRKSTSGKKAIGLTLKDI